MTHVLLPVNLLLRRRDEIGVIGTARAEQVRVVFTRLVVALDPDPPPIEPVGDPVAEAVRSIVAAAGAAGGRFAFVVSPWKLAGAVTSGTLLPPVLITVPINTNRSL
ncbi:hypothetical protein [Nonomuraea insulae]|uniref:Uncharacterized protein n=1 Tax=Nonomuraea insulae TaxID=1616787 RepID=A0ABW1CSF0_9ACTN